MNDRLNRIEEELAAELAQVEGSLREIEQQRDRLVADLERVTACLTALRLGKSTTKKKRGRSRQPCATQDEVASVIQSLIEQNGPCPEDDLIGLAEERLREEGKSLSGFKLRYRGVRQERLVEKADGRLGLLATNPDS